VKRKLPPDAFDHYLSLGLARSYATVAKRYGVSKVTVTKRAKQEGWQKRVAEIEAKARQGADEKAAETMEAINARHLRSSRVIQAKALEALRSMSLDTAMDAVKALHMGVRQERLILGEPTDRNAVNIEDVIKREYEKLMILEGDGDGEGDGQVDEEAA
jgi:transposase